MQLYSVESERSCSGLLLMGSIGASSSGYHKPLSLWWPNCDRAGVTAEASCVSAAAQTISWFHWLQWLMNSHGNHIDKFFRLEMACWIYCGTPREGGWIFIHNRFCTTCFLYVPAGNCTMVKKLPIFHSMTSLRELLTLHTSCNHSSVSWRTAAERKNKKQTALQFRGVTYSHLL